MPPSVVGNKAKEPISKWVLQEYTQMWVFGGKKCSFFGKFSVPYFL